LRRREFTRQFILFVTVTLKPFAAHPVMPLGFEYFRDPRDSRFYKRLLMPFRQTPPETARRPVA